MINNSLESHLNTKICFILGIMPRSGTNYLYQLLEKHPDITALSPIYEDFLVHHSDLLVVYTNSVYKSFGSKWRQEVENKFGSPNTLLSQLGSGLTQFLTQPAASFKASKYFFIEDAKCGGAG